MVNYPFSYTCAIVLVMVAHPAWSQVGWCQKQVKPNLSKKYHYMCKLFFKPDKRWPQPSFPIILFAYKVNIHMHVCVHMPPKYLHEMKPLYNYSNKFLYNNHWFVHFLWAWVYTAYRLSFFQCLTGKINDTYLEIPIHYADIRMYIL